MYSSSMHSWIKGCGLFRAGGRFCILLLLNTALIVGCDEMKTQQNSTAGEKTFIEISEIKIPVFSTSYEQLNYTRSWFADIHEKRAALEAFIRLYPKERKYNALAALDLAYLQLGQDYRFSYEYSSLAAIKSYLAIIEEYSEYPDILAKANWYIGWIYCDLLHDTKTGLEYFYKVAREFPLENISLLPPAPWVFIIYPDPSGGLSLTEPRKNSWAALALVEVIRYGAPEEAWKGFIELWQKYHENAATAFGLRLILKRRIHVEEAFHMASDYMEKNFSNIHMLGDIREELDVISETWSEGVQ